MIGYHHGTLFGDMRYLVFVLLFVQTLLRCIKNPFELAPQCQHIAVPRHCMGGRYHRTHDSVNSFGSSATCFEFVSAYVSFCFRFTMSWESFDLRPLAGFDGRVELLEKEAVWDKKFLHVRDENVMEAST